MTETNDASGEQNTLEEIYSRVTCRLIPLLMSGYMVAYANRVNVGFAKLQMLDDLGFNDAVYGLGAGVFFIGYFLFEVPSNLILNRVGARRWLARIMISWGILSGAMIFVRSSSMFYVLRFLLGAAEAGFFPGVIFYLTQWYPAARRGRVISLFMASVPICNVVGSLVAGVVMKCMNGTSGLAGWQWLFIVEGTPAILLGIGLLFLLTNDIQSASWLTEVEKARLVAKLQRGDSGKQVSSFVTAVQDGRLWHGCVVYFLLVLGLYGIGFWLPTIIVDSGVLNLSHVGMLTAIPYAVATIGMLAVGASADIRRERVWHLAVPAALGSLGLACSVWVSGGAAATVVALSLATFGVITAVALFWSLPTTYLTASAAAGGIAVINSFGNLAGFLGPYLMGWMKDRNGSTDSGVYIIASAVLLAAALVVAGSTSSRPGKVV